MTHIWRWRTTKYGPLHELLRARFGETCRVFARGRNGNVGVEFADGYRTVAPRYAVQRKEVSL